MKKGNRWLMRFISAAAIALVAIAAAMLLLVFAPFFGRLELNLFSDRIHRYAPAQANPDIVQVVMDDNIYQNMQIEPKKLMELRPYHAEMIRWLRRCGAKALYMDIYFNTKSEPKYDDPLISAFAEKHTLPIVVTAKGESIPNPDSPTGGDFTFIKPALFERNNENLYAAEAVVFMPEGSVSSIHAVVQDHKTKELFLHGALAITAMIGNRIEVQPEWDAKAGVVSAGPYSWKVGANGEFILRWTAKPKAFERIEYSQALNQLRNGSLRFKDKIVVLGGDFAEADQPIMSAEKFGRQPGIEVVALALNTALLPPAERPRQMPLWIDLLWMVFLSLMGIGCVRMKKRLASVLGIIGIFVLCIIAPIIVLKASCLWLYSAAPLISAALSVVIASVFESAYIGELTRRFTPKSFATQGIRTTTEIVTVMFADMSGYTRLIEHLPSEEAQHIQSEFIHALSLAVNNNGGVVERTLGDAVMAVFRDANPRRHAEQALKTVPELFHAFYALRKELSVKHNRLFLSANLTIGIESGEVSTGLVDAVDREEISSAGHAVNVASRLQSVCSECGVNVLIGKNTIAYAGESPHIKPYQLLTLKNVSEPVQTYTLEASQFKDD